MSLRLLRPRLGELILTAIVGPAVPVELRALAREFGLGGLLLRAGNVTDVLQCADLAREAQTLAHDVPVWVASHPDDDAWSGLRPPLPAWPPLVTLGRANDETLTRAYATCVARLARALGCTLTFAPVLDVLQSRSPARISASALAADADRVARHGTAFIDACTAVGLATCARHFPGIGGAADVASSDTPGAAPLLETPPDQLEAEDWRPFRAAIAAGVSAVAVAHVYAPGLDEDAPATWSRAVIEGALRQRLGWQRVVVADDVTRMPDTGGPDDHPAVRALLAGCDVVTCGDGDMDRLARTLEAIVRAAEQRLLPLTRLEDALRRHEAMKAATLSEAAIRRLPATPGLADAIGSLDAELVAERMRAWL